MKINDEFDISVQDILGTIEAGITAMLNIEYQNNFYQAIYWYNGEHSLYILSDELEKNIEKIENYKDFNKIEDFINIQFPKEKYNDEVVKLKELEIDFKSYIEYFIEKNKMTIRI